MERVGMWRLEMESGEGRDVERLEMERVGAWRD